MKAFLHRGSFPNMDVEIGISGSKSISNRLLVLQSLFPEATISNLSNSDDTSVLQKGLAVNSGEIDVHQAGTAMRFLTAYFAAREGTEIVLKGSSRMHERPIGILVDALRSLGADIEYLEKENYPPLKINGKSLSGRQVIMQGNVSSQFISALMLIAPKLKNGLCIDITGDLVSEPYLQMTLSLLKEIGIDSSFIDNRINISPAPNMQPQEVWVESDWSSASYFYSLVALSQNASLRLRYFYINSWQGDSILPIIFEKLGVKSSFEPDKGILIIEKTGFTLVDKLELDLQNYPDLAQTLAVTCFGLGIACSLSGLSTLKIKETDRLQALASELRKMGATVSIDENSIHIKSSTSISSHISIQTFQDHRMAMAFAPLAVKVPIYIENAEVVSKSNPQFWEQLINLGFHCNFE